MNKNAQRFYSSATGISSNINSKVAPSVIVEFLEMLRDPFYNIKIQNTRIYKIQNTEQLGVYWRACQLLVLDVQEWD